jgi:hypothetical protein
MTGDPRDPAAGLAEGMEAAGALIESLEQEVASLRGDLEGGPGGGLCQRTSAGGERACQGRGRA